MNGPVRTVAAVHDLSGVGRCALTVAMPVISAMGAQVCPAITAALSAHTGFADNYRIATIDLTDFLGRTLNAWGEMGLEFDAIYTGYLGSPRQAELIGDFIDHQKKALTLIDPVMGDEGRLYSGIDGEMVRAMRALCRRAQVMTPNMTEYAYLTGEEYSLRDRSEDEIRRMLDRCEAQSAIITSIPHKGALVNACRDGAGNVRIMPFRALSRHYPGTGDIFASVLCGALVGGEDLDTAVGRAADFVSACIETSMDIDIDSNFGVQLERALPLLLKGDKRC
jgi:pyridoxine kinase